LLSIQYSEQQIKIYIVSICGCFRVRDWSCSIFIWFILWLKTRFLICIFVFCFRMKCLWKNQLQVDYKFNTKFLWRVCLTVWYRSLSCEPNRNSTEVLHVRLQDIYPLSETLMVNSLFLLGLHFPITNKILKKKKTTTKINKWTKPNHHTNLATCQLF
jgi:hypothetical protein